jgi:hypothetical protein
MIEFMISSPHRGASRPSFSREYRFLAIDGSLSLEARDHPKWLTGTIVRQVASIQKGTEMRGVVAVLLTLLAAAPMANAASPEQAYLTARDHAIAAIKQKPSDKQADAEERLRPALETQLRGLVGAPKLEGFSGPATMSPDTLLADDVGFGALDGISFATKDHSGALLVTTEGLLQHWLNEHKAWWNDQPNPPTDPEGAFHSEAFYTQAVSADAAVSIFAPLPVRKPEGAAVAVGLLVEESQDLAIEPPGQIAVAVIKSGKVFIAIVNAATKTAPIAACDAVWQGYKAKSEAALKAYNDSERKDEKSFDDSTRLEDEGAAALRKCWSEKAGDAPQFSALTKQAQALADLFASR